MNRSLIADRYAKAMFKLAEEQDQLEIIYKDICLLQSYCSDADGFADLLGSPVIKPAQKQEAFAVVLKDKVQKQTIQLINLLISNNREILLQDINRRFMWLYKHEKGIKEVILYTAVELETKQQTAIQNFLHKQFDSPIDLSVKIKPEILGGFVLTIDGKMADASLSTKLKLIKKKLLS